MTVPGNPTDTIFEPHRRFAPWIYDSRVTVDTVDCMREEERLSDAQKLLPAMEQRFLTRRDQFFIPAAKTVAPAMNTVQQVLSQLDASKCEIAERVYKERAYSAYCPPCLE